MKILFLMFLSLPLFSKEMVFENKKFELIGKGLLEYSIFKIDIYELSYYQNKEAKSSLLVIDYKRDLKKEYSVKGWEVGFEKNIQRKEYYKESISWLEKNTPGVKEGDRLILYREPSVVKIFKNNELVAQKKDSKIPEIIFRPWLGQYPVDEELKVKLLGR